MVNTNLNALLLSIEYSTCIFRVFGHLSRTILANIKAEEYSLMFSAPTKGGAQCYASSHSDFHEQL